MQVGEIDNFEELLVQADINASTENEMEFVETIRDKYERFEDSMFISVKQLEYLESLARV